MTLRKLPLGVLAACAVLATHAALAQTYPAAPANQPAVRPPPPDPTPANERRADRDLARADRDFLENASQAGQVEIEASRLAEQSAASAEVKNFARRMIDEHVKSHGALVALATRKGVSLPDDPSIMQRTELAALKAASGETFDKIYASRIAVNAHENAVELFRDAARKVEDRDIKAFAAKQLPGLEKHLALARTLRERVGKE